MEALEVWYNEHVSAGSDTMEVRAVEYRQTWRGGFLQPVGIAVENVDACTVKNNAVRTIRGLIIPSR